MGVTPIVQAETAIVQADSASIDDDVSVEKLERWLEFAEETDIASTVMSYIAIISAFIAIGVIVSKLRVPQTVTEYRANQSEIEQMKVDAKKTETKIDDLQATIADLVNELRPRTDDTDAPESPTESDDRVVQEPIVRKAPDVQIGVPVNKNPDLFDGEADIGDWPDSDRTKQVPPGYTLSWAHGHIGVYPEVELKAAYGWQFALADKDGTAFIDIPVAKFPLNQIFAIAVEMHAPQLNMKADYKGEPGDFIWWDCEIIDGDGYITKLEQPQAITPESRSAVWVINPFRNIVNGGVRLALVVNEAAFTDHSYVRIKRLPVEPQRADFGRGGVIHRV